jgi:hypothetical protein
MTTSKIAATELNSFFDSSKKKVFWPSDLADIFVRYRRAWNMPRAMTSAAFIEWLLGHTKTRVLKLSSGDYPAIIRYTWGDNVSPALIALSTRRQSYFSHGSALWTHGLEDSVSALQNDINRIEGEIEPMLTGERGKRLDLYLDYFDVLKEEKTSLDKLYEPLQAALRQGTDTDKKLEFVSKITFDVGGHTRRAFDLIDSRRRTKYKEKETLEHALRSLMSRIENVEYERALARKEISEFRDSFLKDDGGKPISMGSSCARTRPRKNSTIGSTTSNHSR